MAGSRRKSERKKALDVTCHEKCKHPSELQNLWGCFLDCMFSLLGLLPGCPPAGRLAVCVL